MANTLLTPTEILRESLTLLKPQLNFIGNCDRQYDERFANTGASLSGKIGPNLQIRLPNQYTLRTGLVASVQNTTEKSLTLTVSTVKGVDLSFGSDELALSMQDFSKRVLEPAMLTVSSGLEAYALDMVKDIYQLVGTAGTTPNALSTFLSAAKLLNKSLTPTKKRLVIVDSDTQVSMVDTAKALYAPQPSIAEQYLDGYITHQAGFDWWTNELIPVHTLGTAVNNAGAVNGAGQTGSTLNVKSFAAGATITRGTVFTITSGTAVDMVHPTVFSTYGFAQQFVVTADATCDGSGNAALSISPSITTSGAYQNVTASPDDGAAITIVGTASTGYAQNIAFYPDAFAFVTADLEDLEGTKCVREVYDKIAMRYCQGSDILNSQSIKRLDVLCGKLTQRPSMGCRITR